MEDLERHTHAQGKISVQNGPEKTLRLYLWLFSSLTSNLAKC